MRLEKACRQGNPSTYIAALRTPLGRDLESLAAFVGGPPLQLLQPALGHKKRSGLDDPASGATLGERIKRFLRKVRSQRPSLQRDGRVHADVIDCSFGVNRLAKHQTLVRKTARNSSARVFVSDIVNLNCFGVIGRGAVTKMRRDCAADVLLALSGLLASAPAVKSQFRTRKFSCGPDDGMAGTPRRLSLLKSPR